MSIVDKIAPVLNTRMQKFASFASKLAAKKTGELQKSVIAVVTPSGMFIHIRVKFRIYALILYHMSKSGYRQKRKKGGRVRGSNRFQGANKLNENSKLKQNPEQYQNFIEAVFDIRDEIERLAVQVAQQKTLEEIVNALSNK